MKISHIRIKLLIYLYTKIHTNGKIKRPSREPVKVDEAFSKSWDMPLIVFMAHALTSINFALWCKQRSWILCSAHFEISLFFSPIASCCTPCNANHSTASKHWSILLPVKIQLQNTIIIYWLPDWIQLSRFHKLAIHILFIFHLFIKLHWELN